MKPKWIILATIYMVELSIAMYFLYLFGLLDTTKVVIEVVIGFVLAVFAVIGAIVVYYYKKEQEDNSKRKEKLEKQIEIHNQDLIDAVFKLWYIHKFIFNWYDLPKKDVTQFKEFLQSRFGIKNTEIAEIQRIDDKTVRVFFNNTHLSLNLNDDTTKVSIEIYEGTSEEFIAKEENGKLNIYEINSINEKKESLALEHLKTYTGLCKLREDNIYLQDSISKEEVAINEYILTKLEQSTLLNFTRDCSSDEGSVVRRLYDIIISFSGVGGVPDIYQLHPENNPGLGCAFIFNKNKQELIEHYENSRKQNEIIIKDKTLNEMVGKVINDKTILTKKMDEFEQSIEMIVYNFEKKHIPLEGTCDDCKDWHDKLESLK